MADFLANLAHSVKIRCHFSISCLWGCLPLLRDDVMCLSLPRSVLG